jgi:murein DD-endopeptidase MepM/ murein hydrolase activator NlpD
VEQAPEYALSRHAWLAFASFNLAILMVLAVYGCFSAPPAARTSRRYTGPSLSHRVRAGDTIYHIAHEYGISPERLMAVNNISDPRDLRVGEELIIPSHSGFSTASLTDLPEVWSPPRAARQFAWPVAAGTVSSPFGMRHGAMHDGVDIAAPMGTPVLAADTGVVIYAGRMRGYGNVVIIHHRGSYVTVYAHNRVNLVHEGDQVSRGQEIAEIGETGRASGPNLHFEIRFNNVARNPLAYLPTPQPHSAISFARNGGS